ncbi:MAG TPA: hypothetical protein VFJ57_04985 [Solirubrobacterales bacterium]|nr:hypothetical protein [Solirubrobacterales bacterium]
MIRRRSGFGLCVLAVFVAGAVAAQAAGAATNGTTMFICKKTGKGDFTKAHCANSDKGTGEYSHVTVPAETLTYIAAGNLDTSTNHLQWKLQSTVAGAAFELQMDEVGFSGNIANYKDPTSGEHTAFGTALIRFEWVKVTKPAKETCKVYKDELPEVGPEGEFLTRNVRFTTSKQEDGMIVEPEAGTVLASFHLEKCTNPALNKTYNLTGSFKTVSLSGATANFSLLDTTAQETLKLNGAAAGLEGLLTFEAEDPVDPGDGWTPLSFTTVETK